jgi:hypothetical protein
MLLPFFYWLHIGISLAISRKASFILCPIARAKCEIEAFAFQATLKEERPIWF